MAETKNYTFIRGDTNPLESFRIRDFNGGLVNLSENDQIYFTMKNRYNLKVVSKKINSGITLDEDNFYNVVLKPIDTEELEPGNYLYDIELNYNDFVKTLYMGTIKLIKDTTLKGDRG